MRAGGDRPRAAARSAGSVSDGGHVRVRAQQPDLAGAGAEDLGQCTPRGPGRPSGATATGARPAGASTSGAPSASSTVRPSRASWRSRVRSGRPGTVTGQSGTSTPGAAGGVSPRGGRPANGRPRVGRGQRGVHVPERLGQPAAVDLGAGRRVGAGPLQDVGPVRGLRSGARHQEAHGGRGDVEVLHGRGVPLVARSCPAGPHRPSHGGRRRSSRRRSRRRAPRSSDRGHRRGRPGGRRRRRRSTRPIRIRSTTREWNR